jgi:hypothetical protein
VKTTKHVVQCGCSTTPLAITITVTDGVIVGFALPDGTPTVRNVPPDVAVALLAAHEAAEAA